MSTVAKQFAKIIGDPNHTVKISADSHNQVIGGNYDFSGHGNQRLNYNSIDQLSSAKGGFSPASVTTHETTEAYQGLLNGNNFGQAHQTAIQYENLVRIQEGLGPRIGESSTLTNGGTGARIEVNFSFYKELINVNLQVPSVTSTQSVPSMQPAPVN
ncbi:MAG TPA: hypothetical protein VN622_06175 [Clostridia bacterium]|nr:hypothetical protein [Clostridia bacterium]